MKQIIKYLLIILFIGYYSSISFFVHTHIVEGKNITHSHPYIPFKSNKTPEYNHTTNELLLFQVLSNFLIFSNAFFFGFIIYQKVLKELVLTKEIVFYKKLIFFTSNGLRAPPLQNSY